MCTQLPSRAPALLLSLLLLPPLLSGCGEARRLTDEEVDRIAARTAELLRPTLESELAKTSARLEKSLAVVRVAEKPPAALPPPVMPEGAAPATRPPPTPAIPAPPASAPPAGTPPATLQPPVHDEDGHEHHDHAGKPEVGKDAQVVAVIDGAEEILAADLVRLRQQNERIRSMPPEQGLGELVQFRLMAYAAHKAGLPESDLELASLVQDRLAEFRYEYLIRDTLEKLPPITEEQIRSHYEARRDTFSRPAEMQLSELVVTKKEQAEALAKQATPENFAELAGQNSVLPTRSKGGDMGLISKERVTREAWDALVAAPAPRVLGPFELPGGLYALYLRGEYKTPQGRELADVEAEVRASIERERREQVTEQLVDKARKIWKVKFEASDPEAVKEPDGVLVSIGPQRITKNDLEVAYAQLDRRVKQSFTGTEGKKLFLDLLANRVLLSNLSLTNRAFLEQREPYLADVERQLIINHYARQALESTPYTPTQAEVEARYARDKDRLYKIPPEKSLRARHILIKVGPGAPEAEVATARDKIMAAKLRIEAGEEFAKVAREVSEGPSAPNGGDLQTFGPGDMVPPFDAAVQGLKTWQVTREPIRTDFGFHLILREPADSYFPLDRVRPRLEMELRQEGQQKALADHLASLRSTYPVTYFLDRLRAVPELNQAEPPAPTSAPGTPGGAARFKVEDGKITPR